MDALKTFDYALVKPAGPDCNLACTYCFYYEKQDYFYPGSHRMSNETLDAVIRTCLSGPSRQFGFGWQGGEPTLMGLDFYRKVIELQKNYGRGKRVSNSIQTNGILIDEAWAEFLRECRFLVGLSIDGPARIHDHYRVDQGSHATHARVEKTARLLLESNVEVNALSVVSDYSVHFPEETYRYLKDLGFMYQQYIPCVETDPDNPRAAAPFSVSAKDYGNFLCRLFDLWEADFKDGFATTSIRLFDTFTHIYLGMQPPECTARKTCGNYLVIEHNGEVYSCDFFVEDAWHLGSILTDDPSDLLNSKRQKLFGEIKSKLPEKCLRCEWLSFCRGGCIKDRVRDPRDKRFNHFCESYKIFFSYAHQRFAQLVLRFQEQRATAAAGEREAASRVRRG